jgi:hypothetical protein
LELPQTMKDAIIVARRLEIQYVWIDALCIIQDNAEDKSQEIAVMGQIFSMATITIAAGIGPSVEDGFLMPRTMPMACSLPFYVSDTETGQLWLQDRNPRTMFSPPRLPEL